MRDPKIPDAEWAQILTALRAGNKIQAIKIFRECTGQDLAESKNAIDKLGLDLPAGSAEQIDERPNDPAISETDWARIKDAIRAGNKIEAIKIYRERTSLGLKEAKDAIDALEAKMGGATPHVFNPRTKATGCAGVLLLCAAVVLLVSLTLHAADQPQWGEKHTRNLVSPEIGLPDSFDPVSKKNVKWIAKLGSHTHSSPVVAAGKVFVGTNNDVPRDPRNVGDRGVMMCFDESNGELCWQLVVPKMDQDQFLDWPKMGICSPPSVEGERVYTVTNRGEVICLDIHGMANGNDGPYKDEGRHTMPAALPAIEPGKTDADILWLFDMPAEIRIHLHDSTHSSILIDGPFLYINTCNGVDSTHRKIRAPTAPSLIVLDKATGKLLAQDNELIGPRIFHCTWSSPSLGEINGQKRIFFGGGDGVVYAFEALATLPETAVHLKRVWRFDCDPTSPKENVAQFQGNRAISPSNISGMPVFHKNRIYIIAGGDVWHGKPKAWLKCIDATKTGEITEGGELWSYALSSHSMGTPAIHDGLVYVTDTGKKVHCVDAETGKPYWTYDTKGDMWGSALVADGKVFFGTRKGDFHVLAAGKELKVLSTTELGNYLSGTPTAANGALYIATKTQLFAVKKSAE